MIRPPPPPPKPPRPRRSEPLQELVVDFDLGEPDTLSKNVRVILFQKLAACVDHLSSKHADDLVEIACLFSDATADERELMLRVCRAVPRP